MKINAEREGGRAVGSYTKCGIVIVSVKHSFEITVESMLGCVVAAIAEIKTADESSDFPVIADVLGVDDHAFLMMSVNSSNNLLLENAELVAPITRGKHTGDRGVLKKLASFFVMSFHHSCLHGSILNTDLNDAWILKFEEDISTHARTHSVDEKLAMRSLVVPNQEQDPDPFLGLVLEQVPKIEVAPSRQLPGGLPDQPDLVIDGPAHDIDHVVGLQDGVADVLPALVVLVASAAVQADLRQHAVRHVGVLIQRHLPAMPQREVALLQPVLVRDALRIYGVRLARREPYLQMDGRVRLVRPTLLPDQRDPLVDRLAGSDPTRLHGRHPDQVGAEHVVVFHLKLDLRMRMHDQYNIYMD